MTTDSAGPFNAGPLSDIVDLPGIMASVEHAPHEAQVVDGTVANVRYAVAVTEQRGLEVHKIDDRDEARADAPNPLRAKGTRTVRDVESFLAELDRRPMPLGTGTLWGNAERGEVRAIYNDHSSATGDGTPGWRDDILALDLAADPDWVRWHKVSGHYYPQEPFGDFVEELRHTISSPDQADLLEIIDSIRASTKGEFESSVTRANGGQTLAYKVEVSTRAGVAGRELEVPQHIVLSLRPWEGHSKLYEVPAYFRVRITNGQLELAIKLFPTLETLRQAWTDLTGEITDHLDMPVYAQP
ncbi:DUF2303 family protein [Mycolicibacterium mageritense]|uniref:DUF2303 family protein n=1 Tax=Mycolicibacterium mageritense TaxID=53462 RepID=UPI001E2F7B07|nr:DUF2303 family protein [Mycolicibacterium mageritense]MCC9182593.1 YfdQ family protein [Mycolicibacterium mageritense]